LIEEHRQLARRRGALLVHPVSDLVKIGADAPQLVGQLADREVGTGGWAPNTGVCRIWGWKFVVLSLACDGVSAYQDGAGIVGKGLTFGSRPGLQAGKLGRRKAERFEAISWVVLRRARHTGGSRSTRADASQVQGMGLVPSTCQDGKRNTFSHLATKGFYTISCLSSCEFGGLNQVTFAADEISALSN
jgi:hypothetical protein